MGAEDWNSRPHTYLESDLTQRASPSLRTLLHNPINFCKNFAIGRFFLYGRLFMCLLTSDKEPTRELLSPKSDLVNQWVLLLLLRGMWVKGDRSRNNSQSAVIIKAHPCMDGSSQKLKVWSTLPCLQATHWLESILCMLLSWFVPLSRQLNWSLLLPSNLACLRLSLKSLYCLYLGGRDLVNLFSFRNFLKLFWVVYFMS